VDPETIEIRGRVKAAYLREIQELAGDPALKGTDLLREALTAFRWLVRERAEGRIIMSGEPDGTPVWRLAQDYLDGIRPRVTTEPAAAETTAARTAAR
jgi:hypothetical protein